MTCKKLRIQGKSLDVLGVVGAGHTRRSGIGDVDESDLDPIASILETDLDLSTISVGACGLIG